MAHLYRNGLPNPRPSASLCLSVHMVKPALNSSPISQALGPLGPVFGLSPTLQVHSCLQPLQFSLAHHPLVGKRKHHQELADVLGQAPVTCFAVSKLTLDHPKRVLHLGADARLELFKLLREHVADPRFVQRLAFARHHRSLQVHTRALVLNLLALFNTPVARVGKHHLFLSMQQGMRLRHIKGIGRSRGDRMNQSRLGVHADVRLHPKVPLVGLLGLMHFRVALACVVLGRTGRRNQSGVHHGAGLENQPAGNQFGIDRSQDLNTQVILLKHVPKAQDGAFIRQSDDARIELGKLAVQRDVVQGLFNRRGRAPEELLQQMNAKHHLGGKRRAPSFARRCMRGN